MNGKKKEKIDVEINAIFKLKKSLWIEYRAWCKARDKSASAHLREHVKQTIKKG